MPRPPIPGTIGTDGMGNQTTIFTIPAATFQTLLYQVTWSLTGAGSSGSITVLGVTGPSRSGPGTWTETLGIALQNVNLWAGLTVAWSVLFSGSGASNVSAATLTLTDFSTTFAKVWSWDNLGENLALVYVDVDAGIKTTTFRGASARLSGRTMPAWDAATVVESTSEAASQAQIGFYPNGHVYLAYVNASNTAVYRISNNLGIGSSWSGATSIVYNYSGGLPTGNCGPTIWSQSVGSGSNFFQHFGQTLFFESDQFSGSNAPFQSQVTDGSIWDWNQAGKVAGGQGSDSYLTQSSNPLQYNRAFELGYMIHEPSAPAIVGASGIQDGMLSRPVRLSDGTLAMLAYCSTFHCWRGCNPPIWSWDTGGTNNTLTQSFASGVPNPPGATLTELALAVPYQFISRPWVAGTLATNNQPTQVTFAIPSLRYHYSTAFDQRRLALDVTYVNAKNLVITVGNNGGGGDNPPHWPSGSRQLNGTGRFTYLPDNFAALNAYGSPQPTSLVDSGAITAAQPGNVSLPITYSGTADQIIVNGVYLDLGMYCDLQGPITLQQSGIAHANLWVWTTVSGSHSVNVTQPNPSGVYLDFLGPTTDAAFLAAFTAAAGSSSFAQTLTMNTPGIAVSMSGFPSFAYSGTIYNAPFWHFDFSSVSVRFAYTDGSARFRLMRSRDNGAHWEYAKDGAAIAGLDTLRQFEVLTGAHPLMPMLSAHEHNLYIGWVQGGSPQLLVSADVGETWA